MIASLLHLLRGCTLENFAWLTRGPAVHHHIYCLDERPDGGFEAYHPSDSCIPWPVALLLGAHSKKHVWEPRKAPTMKQIGHAITLFDRRLRWAWVHKDSPSEYVRPLVPRDVLPCRKTVDGAIASFSAAVRNTVVTFVRSAAKVKPCPAPCFVKYAMRWLAQNQYTCELSDKDGVFVVLPYAQFRQLQAREWVKPCYRPVGPTIVQLAFESSVRQSLALADSLAKLGHAAWSSEVRNWTSGHSKKIEHYLCKWSCTVKTHKKPGSIVARSIHSSRDHCSTVSRKLLTAC